MQNARRSDSLQCRIEIRDPKSQFGMQNRNQGSSVKIKKSNSECKMSRRNAVFQFGMQNVKAQCCSPILNAKAQYSFPIRNSKCQGAMQFSNSECKMSRRFQFGMQRRKCRFPIRNAKCQRAMLIQFRLDLSILTSL